MATGKRPSSMDQWARDWSKPAMSQNTISFSSKSFTCLVRLCGQRQMKVPCDSKEPDLLGPHVVHHCICARREEECVIFPIVWREHVAEAARW